MQVRTVSHAALRLLLSFGIVLTSCLGSASNLVRTGASATAQQPVLVPAAIGTLLGTVAAGLHGLFTTAPAAASAPTSSGFTSSFPSFTLPTHFPVDNDQTLATFPVAYPGDVLTITYTASFSGNASASFYTYCSGKLFNGPVVNAGSNLTATITIPAVTCPSPTTISMVVSNHYNSSTLTLSGQIRYDRVFSASSLDPADATPPYLPPSPNDSIGTSPDPVQTSTGSYTYRHTDVATSGRGPVPAFIRAYNSIDTRISSLGPGWTNNYAISLEASTVSGHTSDIVLVGPQGRRDTYTYSSGTYTAPPSVTDQLSYAGGVYTVLHADQSRWTFNTAGQLTSIMDRYGNTAQLSYDASGRLSQVSDPAGRGNLTFSYVADPGQSAHSLIQSVTDLLGHQVQFGYDSLGRLHTVTDRNGQTTTYAYDSYTQNLTSITDANSHVAVTNTYTYPAPGSGPGQVATQTDALSNLTTFQYNTPASGSTTITLPASSFDGKQATLVDTYNSQGELTQRVTTPSNVSGESITTSATYDPTTGFKTSTTDGRGNTTSYCYDTSYAGAAVAGSYGNLTRIIAPPPSAGGQPLVSLFQYDSHNNLVESYPPAGVVLAAGVSSVSCSMDLTNPSNATLQSAYATDLAYDSQGVDLVSATQRFTDPNLGLQTAVTSYAYADTNNPGAVTKITSPRGNDPSAPRPAGCPSSTAIPDCYATTFTYHATGSQAGLLASATDALGNTTTYSYDGAGRKLSMVDPLGNATGGTPSQHTWNWSYDNEDRVLTASAPAPQAGGSALLSQTQYDPVGNRTVVVDANGQVTAYAYDVRDSLSTVTESKDPWQLATPSLPLSSTNQPATPTSSIVTAYSYDHLGNLVRVDRASGDSANERVTDYSYDGLNRVRTEVQYPDTTADWPASPNGSTSGTKLTTTVSYDANGNRLSVLDPKGQTTSFGYDLLNRLVCLNLGTTCPSTGATASYSYDADGVRTSMVDSTGTTSYSTDELGRVTGITAPDTRHVGYRYDLDGNQAKVIYPDGTTVSYSFDAADRTSSLSDGTHSASYSYFADGALQGVSNPNGTSASYTYDNARRLTQVANLGSNGNPISQHSYTLDNVGNRTALSEILPQLGAPGPLASQGGNGDSSLFAVADPAAPLAAAFAAPADEAMLQAASVSQQALPLPSASPTPTAATLPTSAATLTPTPVISGSPTTISTNAPTVVATPPAPPTLGGTPTATPMASSPSTTPTVAPRSSPTATATVVPTSSATAMPTPQPIGTLFTLAGPSGPRLPSLIPGQLGRPAQAGPTPPPLMHPSAPAPAFQPTATTVAVDASPTTGAAATSDIVSAAAASPAGNGTDQQAASVSSAPLFSGASPTPTDPYVWGDDFYGQLGDGSTTNHATPEAVWGAGGTGTLSGVSQVAAGGDHGLALKTDGSVWAWGDNVAGQVGDGSGAASRYTPVQVVGAGGTGTLSGVTAIGAGLYFSVALKSDGSVDLGLQPARRAGQRHHHR